MEYLTYMRTQWHWGSGIGETQDEAYDDALRELHRQGAGPGSERYTWRSWSAPDGSNLRIGHSPMGTHVVTFGDEPSDDDALVLIEDGDFEPTYLTGLEGELPGQGSRQLNPRRGQIVTHTGAVKSEPPHFGRVPTRPTKHDAKFFQRLFRARVDERVIHEAIRTEAERDAWWEAHMSAENLERLRQEHAFVNDPSS